MEPAAKFATAQDNWQSLRVSWRGSPSGDPDAETRSDDDNQSSAERRGVPNAEKSMQAHLSARSQQHARHKSEG
jgi:hypothetical protein